MLSILFWVVVALLVIGCAEGITVIREPGPGKPPPPLPPDFDRSTYEERRAKAEAKRAARREAAIDRIEAAMRERGKL